MRKLITFILILFLSVNPVFAANTNSTDLNGTNHFWSVTDAAQTGLDIASDFTFEAWVKFEALPGTGGVITFLSKGNYGSGGDESYYLVVWESSGTYYLAVSYTNSAHNAESKWTNTSITSAWAGAWHHIAFTADISGPTGQFYIDSSAVTTTRSENGATDLHNSDAAFLVGATTVSGSVARYFNGKIDDVRVWSDIRTAEEIAANYNTELVGNEANLVGYWQFDDSALDETSNNNDLTSNNSVGYSSPADPAFSSGGGTEGYNHFYIIK